MNSTQKNLTQIPVVFLVSAGLALAASWVFAVFATHLGILFSGGDTFFAIFVATALCAIATPITALVFKRKAKHFGWRKLLIEVAVLSLFAVGSLSWLQTRQHLKIFFNPEPIPSGVHVHHGRSVLFSSYVHFSAPPAAIAALIQSKELLEVPSELTDQIDGTSYGAQQRSKDSWDWWQPVNMPKPRFFFRHHKSEAVQGWSEGWWVNDATNEVYAFIGG